MAKLLEKPVGYQPAGWHFHKTFVDDEGNVFHKGVNAPEEKGTMNWTSREKDAEPKGNDRNAEQENHEQSPNVKEGVSDPLMGLDLSPEVLSKLKEMFNEQTRASEEKFKKMFQESLRQEQPSSQNEGMRINDFAQAIAKAEQFQKGGHFYHDIKEFDPSDYDEKGATFTSYGNGYLIVDDVRRGYAVRTPYGRLFKFRFQAGRITRVGRVDNYSSFCSFTTHSKKEIEWLRNHSRYRIEFYEDTNLALDANARKIGIASKIHKMVEAMEQDQILSRAKTYNIPIGGDLGDIKTTLSLAMADEEMQRQAERDEVRNAEAFEHKFE